MCELNLVPVVDRSDDDSRELAKSVLIDVRYAIRQLVSYGDIGRALDALDRVRRELMDYAE